MVSVKPATDAAATAQGAVESRVEELEATLREVLSHIRPQGSPGWELNTCLVANAQVSAWWRKLGVTPTWVATGEPR